MQKRTNLKEFRKKVKYYCNKKQKMITNENDNEFRVSSLLLHQQTNMV
jgi:hypothetical protein